MTPAELQTAADELDRLEELEPRPGRVCLANRLRRGAVFLAVWSELVGDVTSARKALVGMSHPPDPRYPVDIWGRKRPRDDERVVKFAEKVYGTELAPWQRRVLREILDADPTDPHPLKPSPIDSERRP